jgi:uroporphyrinogen decarboxylase
MSLDVSRYFGFERFTPLESAITIDQAPLPRYFAKTLDETADYAVLRSVDGTKKRIIKNQNYSMPMFLEWLVKDREDWKRLKKNLDPTDPRRYPKEWSDEYIEYLKQVDLPVEIWVNGFYGMGRTYMGTVPFVSAFYKDPRLVREMMDFQADFMVEILRKAVEEVGPSIDMVVIHEDMAYKHGPHVSPKLFREFILPGYKKVTSYLRKHGVETIIVDCDGNVVPLIPLFIEGGVNGLWPLEVAAGVDVVGLSKEYGKSLRLIGGMDKRVLMKSKDAIEREVQSKLPYLKEAGGYIPTIDHVIPPDVPLENFRYYADCIKKLL